MTLRGVSAAIEDYLKAIYDLGAEGVKTQELADALSVSSASVSGMLKKLSELKLIHYQKYRGTTLTPAGRKIALETLRHHRLVEIYLAEALGYPGTTFTTRRSGSSTSSAKPSRRASPTPWGIPASTRSATPPPSSTGRCPRAAASL